MKFNTVGTVNTSMGFNIDNPLIIVDFRLKDTTLIGDINAYINEYELENGSDSIHLRRDDSRDIIHDIQLTLGELIATSVGQSAEEIAALLVKDYIDTTFNVSSTIIPLEVE